MTPPPFRNDHPLRRAVLVAVALAACAGGVRCAARNQPAAHPGPAEPVREMRAACKGWLRWEGGKHRFEAVYAVGPPDRLYAEFAGRIGGTQAILSVARGRLLVLIPGERRFVEEEATPAAFEALFGLRLEAGQIVSILGSAGTRRVFSIDGARERLTVRVERDRLRVEPDTATAGRDRAAGGFQGLELKFQEIERPLTLPIDPGLFDVSVPRSFSRITIDPNAPGPMLLP